VKVSVQAGADQDLSDAFRFYGLEAGAGVARRFLGEFERVIRLLNEHPDLVFRNSWVGTLASVRLAPRAPRQ
jgi:plasmid stabilization system protein ParE